MVESRVKAVKIYNDAALKYKLPSLKELEEEFDFELAETSGVLGQIMSRIWDGIMKMRRDIEGLLQPQQYCCLIEHKFFSESEKKELFNVYGDIMANYWSVIRAGFSSKEERAKWIKKSYELYKKLKPFGVKYTTKLIDNWGKKEKAEAKEGYIN